MYDPRNIKFGKAAKNKAHDREKAWDNGAFALWLQDLAAKYMLEAKP
jgi:hypothetical protein